MGDDGAATDGGHQIWLADTGCRSAPNRLDKLGQRSSDTAIIFFDDVRVPARYLIGEAAEAFGASLEGQVQYVSAGGLDSAVAAAVRDVMSASRGGRPGVVLLSPACASFDQFKNFEVRGEAFREMVHAALKAIAILCMLYLVYIASRVS